MALFTSTENLIFNGVDIAASFTKPDDSAYFVVQNVSGRSLDDTAVVTTKVPGRRGSYFRHRDIPERVLKIDFALKAETYEALRKNLEQLTMLLMESEMNEIQFTDELDRTYFGIVSSIEEIEENSRIHKGTISIVCVDPLKYGDTVEKPFVDGQVTVQNGGAVSAEPVFEFTVTKDITNLDVFTGDDYMRIGRALPDGENPIEPKTRTVVDDASTLSGWNPSGTTEGSTVAGTMGTNGFTFQASSYGTGTSWHGPAVQRGVGAPSLQDFEVQATLIATTPSAKHMGKAVVELLDASNNVVGRMIMYKDSVSSGGNTGIIRAGSATSNHNIIATAGNKGVEWRDFQGVVRISRRGNTWEGYIAQVDRATGTHTARAFGRWVDTEKKFTAPITQVRVHFGQRATHPTGTLALRELYVWRLNDTSGSDIPIIAYAGDVIKLDHARSLITVNDEPRNDLKDFGGNYFDIERGFTTVMVAPADAATGTIKFREGYL